MSGTTVIRREHRKIEVQEELPDDLKYYIIDQYSQGVSVHAIAKKLGKDKNNISNFIQRKLKEMNAIRETNDLKNGITSRKMKMQLGSAPTKYLNESFFSLLDTQAEVYAYYYSQTGDNRFSLEQAGLTVGIDARCSTKTKDYIFRIRGQYIRDIPEISQLIRKEQDKRIQEYTLEKPQIQMELVKQIEELKDLAAHDVRQRGNLLKAIELLGRTIGSFTDRIEEVQTNAKSGLEILMEKARGEVYEQAK